MLAIETLNELYRDYNNRFFEAKLPPVLIEYSDKLTRTAGIYYPIASCIHLSQLLLDHREQDTKDTLIHEMIHVAQHIHAIPERPHGPYFSAQMCRINEQAKGEVVVAVTHQIHETGAFEQRTLLGKIKKLLALSESPNKNEAYIAAQKAQRLMAEQRISPLDLKVVELGSELDEPLVNELIERTSQRVTRWKFLLLGAICRVNYCLCLGGGQHGIRALGRRTHIEICRSYYCYFVRLVESEAQKHQGKGKVFLNRFREAMVQEIAARLEQQFKEVSISDPMNVHISASLTLLSHYQLELETFVSLVYPKVGRGKSTYLRVDARATQAGKHAGAKASIAKQIIPANHRLTGSNS